MGHGLRTAATVTLSATAFFTVADIASGVVGHDYLLGAAAAAPPSLWFLTYLMHKNKIYTESFLSPAPEIYDRPLKEAFAKVASVIREYSYLNGHSWHFVSRDTQKRRIVADLKFSETEDLILSKGKERVDRFIRLDVYFDEDRDRTAIAFIWQPKSTGKNPDACDPVISEMTYLFSSSLGPGTRYETSARRFKAPAWLHLVTILSSLFYAFYGFSQAMSARAHQSQIRASDIYELEKEIAAWKKYKSHLLYEVPAR